MCTWFCRLHAPPLFSPSCYGFFSVTPATNRAALLLFFLPLLARPWGNTVSCLTHSAQTVFLRFFFVFVPCSWGTDGPLQVGNGQSSLVSPCSQSFRPFFSWGYVFYPVGLTRPYTIEVSDRFLRKNFFRLFLYPSPRANPEFETPGRAPNQPYLVRHSSRIHGAFICE